MAVPKGLEWLTLELEMNKDDTGVNVTIARGVVRQMFNAWQENERAQRRLGHLLIEREDLIAVIAKLGRK